MHHFKSISDSKWSYSPGTLNSGQNWRWMTSKINRAPHLHYIKLCASFQIHQCFKLELQSEILCQNCQFLSCINLKFDGWPWNTIGHHFYTTSSFVHHHGWIQTRVTVWKRSIWVKIDNLFVLFDIEIWQMTMKNKRMLLLYYIKLCLSAQSHGWLQTVVTVQKRLIQVKVSDLLSHVPLTLTNDIEKQ